MQLKIALGLLVVVGAYSSSSRAEQSAPSKVTEDSCLERLESKANQIVKSCEVAADWVACLTSQFKKELQYERDVQELAKMGYKVRDAAKRIAFEIKRRDCSQG